MNSNYDYIVRAFKLCIFYWRFKLWMIITSVCSYCWWSSISACVFPIMEGKEKRDGKCVWPTISVFLGTSRLISLHSVEGLTWTLDSFPLSPPLSNHPHLIIFAVPLYSFLITPYPSVLPESASISFSVSVSLHPVCSKTSVCKSWAGVGLCSCFLVCVTCFLLNTGYKSLTSLQPLSKALWY